MRNRNRFLSACLDANVIISAIAFGGKPLQIVEKALGRWFHVVTGPNILSEVRRNLVGKLNLKPDRVDLFLNDLLEVASIFVPTGTVKAVPSAADNLVIEVAAIGRCDVLVTGDRRHLLPLETFQGIVIEPPSKFLIRLSQ